MAPRAYWKGYLKLSLVSCPIALFPAKSEREKISFHQLNKNTGRRIKYRKVDAETGDEVDSGTLSRASLKTSTRMRSRSWSRRSRKASRSNAPSDPSRRTWSISWTPLGAASRRAVRLHQTRRKSGRQLLGVHLKNPNTQSGKGRAVPAELSSRKTAFNHPQDRPGVCPSWCAPLTEHRARADTCICGVAALGGRSHHRPAFGRTQLGCA